MNSMRGNSVLENVTVWGGGIQKGVIGITKKGFECPRDKRCKPRIVNACIGCRVLADFLR